MDEAIAVNVSALVVAHARCWQGSCISCLQLVYSTLAGQLHKLPAACVQHVGRAAA
jgi:hypothetical protein